MVQNLVILMSGSLKEAQMHLVINYLSAKEMWMALDWVLESLMVECMRFP